MSFPRIINIGFGNSVIVSRIIAIVNPDSSSGKRLKEESKQSRLLIDATKGRKTRSIIVMDSGHIVLSAMSNDVLNNRIEKNG